MASQLHTSKEYAVGALQKLHDEFPANVNRTNTPDFQRWNKKVITTLETIFGNGAPEPRDFTQISFHVTYYNGPTIVYGNGTTYPPRHVHTDAEHTAAFQKGTNETKDFLLLLMERVAHRIAAEPEAAPIPGNVSITTGPVNGAFQINSPRAHQTVSAASNTYTQHVIELRNAIEESELV
jgi:hypothetical protein